MPYRDEAYDLQVQFHARKVELSAAQRERLEADLDALARLVSCFPAPKLHVHVNRHLRAGDFHVKTSLHLPGRTLFTGERDRELHPAYDSCLRKLVNKVKAYREKLSNKPEFEKMSQGTLHRVRPEAEPDPQELARAARDGEYEAFRRALRAYDEPLSRRIGRWIQRYPQAAAILGRDVILPEIVEEVYTNAFERYLRRPAGRLGGWLESLIEPSLRALLEHTEEEKENIDFLKTLRSSGE